MLAARGEPATWADGATAEYVYNPRSTRLLREAVSQGADVNSTDAQGNTALMCSAARGLVQNVELLLQFGADASLKNRRGKTALDLAENPKSSAAPADRERIVMMLRKQLADEQSP
jgi:ankyrin repeat protein